MTPLRMQRYQPFEYGMIVAVGMAHPELPALVVKVKRLKFALKLLIAVLSETYKVIPFVVAVPTFTNTDNVYAC